MSSNLWRALRQWLGLKRPWTQSGDGVHWGWASSPRLALRGLGNACAMDRRRQQSMVVHFKAPNGCVECDFAMGVDGSCR